MPTINSKTFAFQFAMNSGVYDGTFVLTENRLITVSVMGQKRSAGLGHRPPRALALALAMDLIRDFERAESDALAEQGFVGRLLSRFGQLAMPLARQPR